MPTQLLRRRSRSSPLAVLAYVPTQLDRLTGQLSGDDRTEIADAHARRRPIDDDLCDDLWDDLCDDLDGGDRNRWRKDLYARASEISGGPEHPPLLNGEVRATASRGERRGTRKSARGLSAREIDTVVGGGQWLINFTSRSRAISRCEGWRPRCGDQ